VIDTDGVAVIEDPAERALRAIEMITELQATIIELSGIRRVAILEMVNSGMAYKDVAARLGITMPRVGQIVNARPVKRIVVTRLEDKA
jgi:DNA-binding NarL/FixJ family response regulator